VEAARKHAVKDLEPFFKYLSKVFATNPVFLREPQRIMNLDETPLSRQPGEFSDSGVVSDMSITHDPKQTAKGKAPPSATAVTVSYASGTRAQSLSLPREAIQRLIIGGRNRFRLASGQTGGRRILCLAAMTSPTG